MRTSKETQLEILDKMRENVINGLDICNDIEYWGDILEIWLPASNVNKSALSRNKFRVKPTTITVNGVEIPKPLSKEQLEEIGYCPVYYPISSKLLYNTGSSTEGLNNYFDGMICYKTKEEAIKASKLLFGIK